MNMHGLSINISHSSTCFVSSVCHIFISYLSSACAFAKLLMSPSGECDSAFTSVAPESLAFLRTPLENV